MSAPTPQPISEAAAQRVLVWDLPIRIFHWLLAASFLLAWVLAVTSDDESRAFAVHALLGLFIAALVAFRLVWGLIGTRHARFNAFATRPAALAAYLKSVVSGPGREYVGHNPASSYTTCAMLILLIGLVWTGVLLGRGNESVGDLHEVLAHSMLALVGIHVLGVILHTVRHRDPITLSMIDGRKRGRPPRRSVPRDPSPLSSSECCWRPGPRVSGGATTRPRVASHCRSSARASRSVRERQASRVAVPTGSARRPSSRARCRGVRPGYESSAAE